MTSKKSSNKETILITGGSGLIGSHLTKLFLEQGDKVVIYDLFKNYVSPLRSDLFYDYLKLRLDEIVKEKIEVIEGDIRDPHRFVETLREVQPDKIVHLAAIPIADLSDKYPYEAIEVNLNGTLNILNSIKNTKPIRKFVCASSSMVYGDFQYKPCDEKHPTQPIGLYGGSKLAAEIMTRIYTHRFDIPHVIVRPSAVYGPTDCNLRVTQLFIEKAMRNEPLTLHDKGSAELDFTYVEDIAEGFYLATKSDVVNETFNITRGEGRSLNDFVEILKNYFPKLKVTYVEVPEKKRKPNRGELDIRKAHEMLGYKPKYSLEDGLKKYISFIQEISAQ